MFKIGNKNINSRNPTYFIAEIGSNFDGSKNRAKKLISLAKESGADAAKFQHYTAGSLVNQNGFDLLDVNSHQKKWSKSVFETYDKASLDFQWTEFLVEECRKNELDFLTSPYSLNLLKKTIKYIPAIKIGSGDITYLDIIKEMTKFGKPILLATGASSMNDVERAMKIINDKVPVCLMQCNTNYEAKKLDEKFQNIKSISTYKTKWPNIEVGLSCHMLSNLGVYSAVTLGARVIEKHFTDDNSREGPDHKFAQNPESFKNMVKSVRSIEKMLGDGIKKIENNEKETFFVQRRALVTNKNFKKGTLLQKDGIEALRPFIKDSYAPYEIDNIVGKVLKKDIKKGTTITKEYLEDNL